jgi:hypothetical protein
MPGTAFFRLLAQSCRQDDGAPTKTLDFYSAIFIKNLKALLFVHRSLF